MYFSSGTSGNPKMVLHDHTYALAHLFTARHWHNVVPDGLHFTIADTGWGKAVWGKLFGQWIMETCLLVYDFLKFKPAEILSCLSKLGKLFIGKKVGDRVEIPAVNGTTEEVVVQEISPLSPAVLEWAGQPIAENA